MPAVLGEKDGRSDQKTAKKGACCVPRRSQSHGWATLAKANLDHVHAEDWRASPTGDVCLLNWLLTASCLKHA
jgi:hypothetical protein